MRGYLIWIVALLSLAPVPAHAKDECRAATNADGCPGAAWAVRADGKGGSREIVCACRRPSQPDRVVGVCVSGGASTQDAARAQSSCAPRCEDGGTLICASRTNERRALDRAVPSAPARRFGGHGDVIFTVPVGTERGLVSYVTPSAQEQTLGPESFAVADNGDFHVLDTQADEVEVFTADGQPVRTVPLPKGRDFWDVLVTPRSTYYLDREGTVWKGEDEPAVVWRPHDRNPMLITGFVRMPDGMAAVRFDTGEVVAVESTQTGVETLSVPRARALELQSMDGTRAVIDYQVAPPGAYGLARNPAGDLVVVEHEAMSLPELVVETRVEMFRAGEVVASHVAAPPPARGPKPPRRGVAVSTNGGVYQMRLEAQGPQILRLYSWPARPRLGILPEVPVAPLVKPAPAASPAPIACGATRADAFPRAIENADHKWTFKAGHLTSNTATTKPPDYLANAAYETQQVGIPYCWGGTDSVDTTSSPTKAWATFDKGLVAGKTAGNVKSGPNGWVSSTVGLDCSGLITAAYKCAEKLSTSSIAGSRSPFKKLTSFNDLVRGDIANKPPPDGHVWMFDEFVKDTAGTVVAYLTVEATVKNADKTHREKRTLAETVGYTPMTLK